MRILTVVSSIASILGLFISLFCNKKGELSALEWIAIVVFCLSSLYWFIDWFRHRPISYDEMDKKSRDEYMKRLISTDEHIFVFTKSMSWADSTDIKEILKNKAKQRELTICIPKSIPQAQELKEYGAKVIEYDYLDYTPMARFTIVRYSTDSAKLSVGRTVNDTHTIEEYRLGEHTCFSLATDLIRILEKLDVEKQKREKQEQERIRQQQLRKEKREKRKQEKIEKEIQKKKEVRNQIRDLSKRGNKGR